MHVLEVQKVGARTVGVVTGEWGGGRSINDCCKLKQTNKNFVSHLEASSVSISEETPKRGHTHELACKLTSPFRFKLHTKR